MSMDTFVVTLSRYSEEWTFQGVWTVYNHWSSYSYSSGADIGKKMNLLKISRFPDFIQYLLDFSHRFPDFSLTKFFKVRNCERCDSLNPRLFIQ